MKNLIVCTLWSLQSFNCINLVKITSILSTNYENHKYHYLENVWKIRLLKMNACSPIERQQRINHRSTFTTTIERNEHQIVIFVCSLSIHCSLFNIIQSKIIYLFQHFNDIRVVKSTQFSNNIKITNSKDQKIIHNSQINIAWQVGNLCRRGYFAFSIHT